MIDFLKKLDQRLLDKDIPRKYAGLVLDFCKSYISSARLNDQEMEKMILCLVDLLDKQIKEPFNFEPFHQKITKPFDYYSFGNDFVAALIDRDKSKVLGEDHLKKAVAYIESGENVIFFANHQIEADPQIISILLGDAYSDLAQNFISVAGERVLKDHLAAPFSMGRNLLCIYSKKHIDSPPELREAKMQHNKRTMNTMRDLFVEGGKAIYVAPSGGRDRKDEAGEISLSPFDPQSIAMFTVIARSAKTPCHYFPLALSTYDLLPPPESIGGDLGEKRLTKYSPAYLAFGEEIDFSKLTKQEGLNKQEKRQAQADAIYQFVLRDYQKIKELK